MVDKKSDIIDGEADFAHFFGPRPSVILSGYLDTGSGPSVI